MCLLTPCMPDSFSNVKKMEPLIDNRIHEWIQRLDERFAGGHKMDFAQWAVFVVYDIISEVGFGEWILPIVSHDLWTEMATLEGRRLLGSNTQ